MRVRRLAVLAAVLLLAGCPRAKTNDFPSPREAKALHELNAATGGGPGIGPHLVFARNAGLTTSQRLILTPSADEHAYSVLRWWAVTEGLVQVDAFGGAPVPSGMQLGVGDLDANHWTWSAPGTLPPPLVTRGTMLLAARADPFGSNPLGGVPEPLELSLSVSFTALALPPWTRDRALSVKEVPEPSGLDWDFQRDLLWVVGDEGVLGLVDPRDGTVLRTRDYADDYEAVRWVPGWDLLLLSNERLGTLLIVDPETLEPLPPVTLIATTSAQPAPIAGGNGFEGLAVTSATFSSTSSGGLYRHIGLIAANQDDPHALYTGALVIPGGADVSPPHAEIVTGFAQPAVNLSEVALDWGSRRAFNLHGYVTPNRLVLLDGALAESVTFVNLGELSAEGATFAPDGALWLANDTGGIVRYAP